MKLKRIMAMVLCFAMVLSTMSFSVFATETTTVAKIGETGYDSLDAALAAAKEAGQTEVEITVTGDIKLSNAIKDFTKVTFTGSNREQTIDMNLGSAIDVNTELVFNDLTVSRLDAGTDGWLYHYTYIRGGLTYNNCKMVGVFNVTVQDTDFIGCDFYNDDAFGDGNYSLWLYNCAEGVEVNITDCTFDVFERAIKMYGDNYADTMTLNISGTEFKSRNADKTVVEMAYDNANGTGAMNLNITESTATGFGAPEHIDGEANAWFNVEGSETVSTVTVDNKVVYTDVEAATPEGTITPAYTTTDRFWGEAKANATESLVVELYEGETKIGSSTLNSSVIGNQADGSTYVTWSLKFNDTSSSWTYEWAEGYPKYDMNPDAVKLVVDGTVVATNNVQYNGADNLNKIVALAEGFTGGVVAYTSLAEAVGNFNGRQVNVLRDVTESFENFNGCTLTTNVEGGVTISNTYDGWINANDFNIGKGVAVVGGNVFYETDGVNTIEGTLNVTETLYHGYNAKTTVQNGGKVIVNGSTILRYNSNADAGLYIYGDNDDSTVEFDCDYYIGAYSGTFYAEDAAIDTGYFLLKNSYDDSTYADIAMTLDNSNLTVVGTTDTQDSFIIDDQASLTLKNGSTIDDVRDFSILAGTNLELSIDEASSISATNMSIADDVPFEATENADGTYGVAAAAPATPEGALNAAYTSASYIDGVPAVFGEATGVVGTESFEVKLYSGENLVGTTALVDNDKILLNGESKTITWHAALTDDGDTWWSTTWENGALKISAIPDKAELWVDGTMVSTCGVQLNLSDYANPVFAAVTDNNGNVQSFVAATGYLNGTGANAPVYDEALQTALNAGGNITLLRDVTVTVTENFTVDKDVTLDLGDKTITSSNSIQINSGNVTIKNGTIDSTTHAIRLGVNGDTNDSAISAVLNIESNATIKADGCAVITFAGTLNTEGILETSAENVAAIQGNGNAGNTDTVINITGGTITGTAADSMALYIPQNGVLNITGGTITAGSGIFVKNGKVSVTDGTIVATNVAEDNETQGSGASTTGIAFVVEASKAYGVPVVSITGGNFISKNSVAVGSFADENNIPVTGFISGGTFKGTTAPDASLAAAGYEFAENSDGAYGVVVDPAHGKTIEVTYADGTVEYFTDMLEAVPYTTNYPKLEGATVKLLANIEAPGIRMMENDMVLDLNGFTYTITAGTGSQGTNTSGFQIRPEVTTAATIKNGTIKVAEGAPVVWMFNSYAAEFIVNDVTVDCTNMAWSYGTSVYAAVSRSGDNVQFTGKTQIENFNSEVGGPAINVGGTMTIDDTANPGGTIELDAGATLTARENLAVVTADNCKLTYENGTYTSVACVAKIGDTKYESLAEALTAATDGKTIELIWEEGDAPIAMNGYVSGKTVTITGTAQVDWEKDFLFVGRTNDGTTAEDATLIFKNANLTTTQGGDHGIHVSGTEKDSATKADGTVQIIDSTINLSYLINKGSMTLDNSTLTVKSGFSVGGRPASETESGEDATATMTLNNNSNVIVNNHNGMGLGYEAIGVMNIDATSVFETTQSFLVTAKGTMNIEGTAKIAGTLTNNGEINLADANATLTSSECGNVTAWDNGYNVVYVDGVYVLEKAELSGDDSDAFGAVNASVAFELKDGYYTVVTLAAIDTLYYSNVGFTITFDGETVEKTTNVVYNTIRSTDAVSGEVQDYTAAMFGNDKCNYIFGQMIEFAEVHAGESFTYRPFATKLDGTRVYGKLSEAKIGG